MLLIVKQKTRISLRRTRNNRVARERRDRDRQREREREKEREKERITVDGDVRAVRGRIRGENRPFFSVSRSKGSRVARTASRGL